MPYSDFIPVKDMEGELIVSQKRGQLGCTLTTKELIFQKPHISYRILLKDTLGIVPFQLKKPPTLGDLFEETEMYVRFHRQYYRISVSKVHIINRNGRFEKGSTDIMVPLNDRFIQFIEQYADFASVATH
ncbi:hypothetical protein GCM10011571_22700 [Marinithermofilum abyssi]|uniref:Uncharacterized protein n=1 Tax=Marinithermofilum abyssi TaxID=1571185 RepID=A0A8J2VI34_9BACL|nr:hypothetical protein [Marinithermofilum abyssi]GGE20212.1 hypothetical protein GCM10011571_22700 [Marinithermofilum abyssi]